jgi:hypothetical protein
VIRTKWGLLALGLFLTVPYVSAAQDTTQKAEQNTAQVKDHQDAFIPGNANPVLPGKYGMNW